MAVAGSEYLSNRAQLLAAEECFLSKYAAECMANRWSVDNPNGMVNIGTAENYLCEDLLVSKYREEGMYEFDSSMLHYYPYHGRPSTRKIAAKFIQKHARVDHDMDPDNIVMVLGTSAAFEIAAHVIGDCGDALLCPTPYYGRIRGNCYERALVDIFPVRLSSQMASGETSPFQLTLDRVKAAYEDATTQGKRVRGMVILNPSNPLGTVYSREELLPILEFLAEKRLYCILDEIYMLSIFNVDGGTKFDSVLSYWNQLPDPKRTVWLWGFSKDFASAGARVSFIYCPNAEFMDCVKKLVSFQCVPIMMHRMVEKLLQDEAWIEKVYLPTNLARIKENYGVAVSHLRRLSIPFLTTRAGFFIFVDFGQFLKEPTYAAEWSLFETFFKGGVYVVPGETFHCSEPGWFRIVFTVSRAELEEGLGRMERVLTAMKSGQSVNGWCDDLAEAEKFPGDVLVPSE